MNSSLFTTLEKKANGIVYTPSVLSEFVASKVISFFLNDLFENKIKKQKQELFLKSLNKYRFLDPACGEGELLCSIWSQLIYQLPDFLPNFNGLFTICPQDILCGIDTDSKAITISKKRIRSLDINNSNGCLPLKFINTNALFPFNRKLSSQGWQEVFNKFEAKNGFDIVIANPPWGADISSYKNCIKKEEFSLFKGQFDSSDLFLERALSITKPNGYFAFIVPDSLFGLERRNLREILLSRTEIKFIARLGERIFSNINRACAVIICRKREPDINTKTQCFRLTPHYRKMVLNNESSLLKIQEHNSHYVAQCRFNENPNYRFDIDLDINEQSTLKKFLNLRYSFRNWLSNSRGVELSKNGFICKCSHCGYWMPRPKMSVKTCLFCGRNFKLSNNGHTKIISSKFISGSQPIFVGENIQRYQLREKLWINTKKKGINYKSRKLFEGPKILIRKTGVGISAAIDYSNNLTNQVVYMFRIKDHLKDWIPLEIFLGILNSRALFYFIIKSHGETEWRSHPYITQNQILDIPFPGERYLLKKFKGDIEVISELIRTISLKNIEISPEVDSRIENFVSRIYGLTKGDYSDIYKTLENAEELLPVKALKRISIEDIFKNKK